jgi:hypothetical protein
MSDFGQFLDWNRYMLIGLSLWTLLVAFVVSTSDNVQCTEVNSFAGVVWIVGLVLLFFTVSAELFTDIKERSSASKKRGKSLFSKFQQHHDITWPSIIWRFISNVSLFYVIIAIGSYNWFPVGKEEAGCFIPWTQKGKDQSLIVVGAIAFLFLIMRVLVFNYENIPQDQRVAEILGRIMINEHIKEYDFGKNMAKLEPIIANFGTFTKRLKRRKMYFSSETGLLDDKIINGPFPPNILDEPDYDMTDTATIELTLQKMRLLSHTLSWLDKTLDELVSNPIPTAPQPSRHVHAE